MNARRLILGRKSGPGHPRTSPQAQRWLSRGPVQVRFSEMRIVSRKARMGFAPGLGPGACGLLQLIVLSQLPAKPPLPPVTWQVTFFGGASPCCTRISTEKVTCQAWQVTLAG